MIKHGCFRSDRRRSFWERRCRKGQSTVSIAWLRSSMADTVWQCVLQRGHQERSGHFLCPSVPTHLELRPSGSSRWTRKGAAYFISFKTSIGRTLCLPLLQWPCTRISMGRHWMSDGRSSACRASLPCWCQTPSLAMLHCIQASHFSARSSQPFTMYIFHSHSQVGGVPTGSHRPFPSCCCCRFLCVNDLCHLTLTVYTGTVSPT